ncbi:T9SS type A sorting domain-containing protein [Tenacibaculum amylolyticum]|uniref:T9SS type A sorting domain-containing protein n=1 Tax=Tenacibaculum amylolyticum TaxID=104269 RepID=UPI0038952C64
MRLFYILFLWIYFTSTLVIAQLQTTVELVTDTDITPTNNELVTFGLPIKKGLLTNLTDVKVTIGSTEQAISIEKGLTWWSDNSIRSVIIQLQGVDMTKGNVSLTITDDGRNTANDLVMLPHHNGWVQAGANKSNMSYPRIFVLHDIVYLSESNLVPPYISAPSNTDAIELYKEKQFDDWAGSLDYPNSSNGNWLFDRATAMAKAYMTTGNVKYLKEAFLSKQFYFEHIRKDETTPAAQGGNGCWTWGATACADGKYIYTQPAKLLLGLIGDKSQWTNQLIIDMALQADLGWNQYRTRDTYDKETEGFTERAAGIVGMTELFSYEITGDATILNHMNERIASLKDMQQTSKSWDISNNWTPKSGAFTHSVGVHEGNYSVSSAPLANTNDRGFSPWMSENITDFLWSAYWITNNPDIPEILRQLGNAVERYGFTTSYNSTTNNYDFKTPFASINSRSHPCMNDRKGLDLTYFASAYASEDTISSDDWYPWYTSTHNVEAILVLGTAYYFETDPSNKVRLKARLDKLRAGIFTSDCAAISIVPRLWNWQHRSNSVRTWDWILANDQGILNVPQDEITKQITFFPNPFEDQFSIKLDQEVANVNISLQSILGETIFEKKYLAAKTINLELADISKGVYLVTIQSKKINTTFKIIKN